MKIQSSPKYHSQGGRPTKNHGENRNDWRIEDQSAQDGGQRRSEQGGQRGAPELARVMDGFILKEAKPGGEQKPGNDKGKECCCHTRQKG